MRHHLLGLSAALLLLAVFSSGTGRAEPARGSDIGIRATQPATKAVPKDLSKWGRALKSYPLENVGINVTAAPLAEPNRIVIAVRSCPRSGDLKGDGPYQNRFYCPMNLPIGAKIRTVTAFPREAETWNRYREVMSETSMMVVHVWRENVLFTGTRTEEIPGTDEPGFLLGGRAFWMTRDMEPMTIHYETEPRPAMSAYYISVDNSLMLNVDATTSSEARIFLSNFDRDIQAILGALVVEYEPASN